MRRSSKGTACQARMTRLRPTAPAGSSGRMSCSSCWKPRLWQGQAGFRVPASRGGLSKGHGWMTGRPYSAVGYQVQFRHAGVTGCHAASVIGVRTLVRALVGTAENQAEQVPGLLRPALLRASPPRPGRLCPAVSQESAERCGGNRVRGRVPSLPQLVPCLIQRVTRAVALRSSAVSSEPRKSSGVGIGEQLPPSPRRVTCFLAVGVHAARARTAAGRRRPLRGRGWGQRRSARAAGQAVRRW